MRQTSVGLVFFAAAASGRIPPARLGACCGAVPIKREVVGDLNGERKDRTHWIPVGTSATQFRLVIHFAALQRRRGEDMENMSVSNPPIPRRVTL
jgi:hypothetical protein